MRTRNSNSSANANSNSNGRNSNSNHLPLPLQFNPLSPIQQTNTHNMPPSPTPNHTQSPNLAYHPGLTNTRIKTEIDTTIIVTLRPGNPRDHDHHLGQTRGNAALPATQPLPQVHPPGQTNIPHHPRFYLLPTYIPCPGQINATADANHILPVSDHHHGQLYPATPLKPHKTAETPSVESRRNPELFRIKFPFSFIFHLLSLIPLLTLLLPDLLLSEGTPGNELRPFPIFLRGAPVAVLPSVSATSNSVATYHI